MVNDVALVPVSREQAETLSNLLQLYAHDFSEIVPLQLQANGRFDLALGPQWWNGDDHFPFLIRVGEQLSGFALVRRGSRINGDAAVIDVAEFFVIRGARGRGVGMRAAQTLFGKFAGTWEVRVRRANPGALQFWLRAVETWLGATVAIAPASADGIAWNVLRVPARPT